MHSTDRVRTIPGSSPRVATAIRVPTVCLLGVLAGLAIAAWAFVYGDQPVVLDAAGYYEFGRVILAQGLGGFASDTRTYGYPAFLAAIMLVVGQDLADLQPAVFLVQLALL